jgi:alpha-1,2-mannosyltransferase
MPLPRRILVPAAAFILGVVIFVLLPFIRKGMVDFDVNRQAGERVFLGETLYRTGDAHYQFKYPPFAAILYVPFSRLPESAAKAVWFLETLASSAAVFLISFRLVHPEGRASVFQTFLPLLVLGRYFLREIQLGQVNAFLTAILLFSVLLSFSGGFPRRRIREGSAGLIWGFSTAIKPYALIFFPYGFLRKKWLALASGFLFLALAFLTPVFFYGFKGNLSVHKEWIASLTRSTPSLFGSQDNISIVAMFYKGTGNPGLSRILAAMVILLIGAAIYFLIVKTPETKNTHVLESGLLLTLIPLISPLGWDYTLLSSALAVTFLFRHFSLFPRLMRGLLAIDFALIALSLYDLMGKSLYARYMAFSIPTICFLLLAGALAWLRIEGKA